MVNGVAAGTLNYDINQWDEWYDNTTGVDGSKQVTIAPRGGDVYLYVFVGASCAELACFEAAASEGTATCPVPDEPSMISVGVPFCCGDVPYTLAVTGGAPLPDDLPEPGVCDPAFVCVGLFPGDVVASFPVVVPGLTGGDTHHVAAYVDLYRFVLPGGGSVSLPCAVLTGDVAVNPCEQAGGTFISRFATLADRDVSEPAIGGGTPLVTIRICEATLVATVVGAGVESFPAYTVC